MALTNTDKHAFFALFNRGGYILDFSTSAFDQFTVDSIGIALTQKYQKSKGKSFEAFSYEYDDQLVLKLYKDLIEFYENHYLDRDWIYGEDPELKYRKTYKKARAILDRELKIIPIESPSIKTVDRAYIKDLAMRIYDDIDRKEFDSAITKSRTLLEEVFIEAIVARDEKPVESGKIKELYKQVKDLYNMHGDKDTDKRINTLLSGLEKILTAISEMRNSSSDAHGVGEKRIPIRAHHCRLFANSAISMAEFILSVKNGE